MGDTPGDEQVDTGGAGEAAFVGVVLVALFFALCRGWYTPEVVVFLSLLVVWNAGIVSTAEALSGFNNPGVLAIGALFVVVASIESSKVADKAAKNILGLTTTFSSGFCRLLLCGVSMSAFCNNTPILALLIPVTEDWARARGFSPPVLLMPLAFACAFGGILTTVGGGTNLVIQGLLYEASKEDESVGPFRLFEPGFVGLPLAIAGIFYLLVAAPRLLAAAPPSADGGGFVAVPAQDRSGDLLTEVEIKEDFKLVDQPFSLVLASLGLPMDTLVKKGVFGSGSGVGSGAEAGGEEQPGWAGRIAASSSRHAGGGRKPFALRRRATAYQPLENEDGAVQTQGSDAGAPCIEMATLRTAGAAVGGPGTAPPQSVGAFAAVDGATTTHDLHDVAPDACVRAGDVLVLSCGRSAMVDAQGSWFSAREPGLGVLGLSTLRPPPRTGSAFFELVLSRTSRFLGRTARSDGGFFSARYGCSVVAFRLKGSTGGGVDLLGRSAAGECDRGGNGGRHDAVDTGDSGETTCLGAEQPGQTSGDGLFETSGACGSPQSFAGAEAFFIGGPGDSPTVRGDRSSPGSTALSPSVGDESPARLSEPEISGPVATPCQQQPTKGAGLDAKSQRRRQWGRRRGEAFEAGDVVVVLATEQFSRRFSSTSAGGEFLRNRPIGRVPEPTGWFHYFPLVIFTLMLLWVLLGGVDMIRAVFAASAVLLLGGWVDANQAVGHVNWGLLLLIGSALGFSKAIANSGLAAMAGKAVRESGMSPPASLYALFLLTMLCTELISNNSAAALNIPIALSMARELEADYKPFAMTVLVAASCSFLTPIGTPTNTLVWQPGGYKFQDYAKLGAPLTLLFWASACTVIPWLFPF
ncbi:sodium/sulfate symporter [Ectocarpus siliculosus]|uniref:Sodium/sulfate symporter n=1 Tax=Ectocarpus siliculosus TaxID=2880 RepID=D8LFP7_ECTSI|nr:sodium/sulfate symporter [Ectocarpus siliculosus]|eukprot:CBN75621.1 sodium/sulfate symporter [Ectocarpus siliculosus]